MSKWLCIVLVMSALVAIGCGSTQDQIESARFQLDKGNYENAITILTPLHDSEPDNNVVTSLLASAHLALGLFGPEGSYLSVLANYLRGKEAGLTNMESIRDATPAATGSGRDDVFTSTDLIDSIPDAERTRDDHFLKGVSELATISVVGVAIIGALDAADPCDIDFDAIDADPEATVRFGEALANVKPDFEKAGIDMDNTELGEQVDEMNNDFILAVNLRAYLEAEYGATMCP